MTLVERAQKAEAIVAQFKGWPAGQALEVLDLARMEIAQARRCRKASRHGNIATVEGGYCEEEMPRSDVIL